MLEASFKQHSARLMRLMRCCGAMRTGQNTIN